MPLTVKLPVTVASPPTLKSAATATVFGNPIVILLLETAVSISLFVPSNVSVSVPTVTVSLDPLSAAIVNVLLRLLISPSTYVFVAGSLPDAGLGSPVILWLPYNTCHSAACNARNVVSA